MLELDDSSGLLPIYFCTAPPDRYLVSSTAASITVGVSCLVASMEAQWRSHLPRFWNAHRASWSVSLVFISRRMMPVGALLWGRHPWAWSQRPETVCGLRCFAAVGRQLLWTMVSTPSVSLILREKALTWRMKYLAPAWVMRATTRAQRILVRPHYATDYILKGFVSQLNLAMKHGKGKNGTDSQSVLQRQTRTSQSCPRRRSRSGSIGRHLCWRT